MLQEIVNEESLDFDIEIEIEMELMRECGWFTGICV